MSISVTDIGHNSNTSGATVAVTVPGGGVAAGSLVLVLTDEKTSLGAAGTVADTQGNTYTKDTTINYNGGNNNASIFRSVIGTGLVSGNSITLTKHTSGKAAAISAFYATSTTGWPASPLDSATAPTSGNSTTPSIGPSATPSVANSLLAAGLGWDGSGAQPPTFTQDTGNGWPNGGPFDVDRASTDVAAAGGWQQSSSALTFAPTIGTSQAWGALLAIYKPVAASIVAWHAAPFDPQPRKALGQDWITTLPPAPPAGVGASKWFGHPFDPPRGKLPGQDWLTVLPPAPPAGVGASQWFGDPLEQPRRKAPGKDWLWDSGVLPPAPPAGVGASFWFGHPFDPPRGKLPGQDWITVLPPAPPAGVNASKWFGDLFEAQRRKSPGQDWLVALPTLVVTSNVSAWFGDWFEGQRRKVPGQDWPVALPTLVVTSAWFGDFFEGQRRKSPGLDWLSNGTVLAGFPPILWFGERFDPPRGKKVAQDWIAVVPPIAGTAMWFGDTFERLWPLPVRRAHPMQASFWPNIVIGVELHDSPFVFGHFGRMMGH